MFRISKHLLTAAICAAAVTGCSDFLSGPSVETDPNNPTPDQATANQLFVAFQAAQYTNFEGTLAYTVCIWMHQCAAAPQSGRFLDQQGTFYIMDPTTFDGQFQDLYLGGGLLDIRTIQQKADEASDPVYKGVAQVWEAIIMSEAADKWGDIPYSEAVSTVKTPKVDQQADVYAALLALLDDAIANLAKPGSGPAQFDFAYGGNPVAWTALAHTLKARILLHAGGPFSTNPNYAQVAAEAAQGLPADGSEDFKAVVDGSSSTKANGWFQFYSSSGFGPDLIPGSELLDTLRARQDSRLLQYFAIESIDPSTNDTTFSLETSPRTKAAFAQPWVTGEENALIAAEAAFKLGDNAGALGFVNTVRAAHGLAALGGPVTLRQIIEEKYISLFQNYEVWNDFKRTGCPAITPTANDPKFGGQIPRRIYYGQTEQNSNPNIPSPAAQLANGFLNDNDPGPQVCP